VGSTNKPGHEPNAPAAAVTDWGVFRYGTAAAFRTALRDRFTAIAGGDDRYPVDELARQFAYDRALARLFTTETTDRWVGPSNGQLETGHRVARASARIPTVHGCRFRTGKEATLIPEGG